VLRVPAGAGRRRLGRERGTFDGREDSADRRREREDRVAQEHRGRTRGHGHREDKIRHREDHQSRCRATGAVARRFTRTIDARALHLPT